MNFCLGKWYDTDREGWRILSYAFSKVDFCCNRESRRLCKSGEGLADWPKGGWGFVFEAETKTMCDVEEAISLAHSTSGKVEYMGI